MFVFSARNVFRLLDFRQSSRPPVLDLLGSVRDPDGRCDVESVQQGRSAGLGRHHSDRERLFYVQGRWSTGLVVAVDADPIGQFHYRDHSERRHCQTLWQRRWVRDRHALPAIHILANPWVRQRPISRRTAVDTDNGLILLRPARRAFFIERRNAFARFGRFARLEVMFQRKIDIFFYRRRPELFDQTLGLRDRIGRALQN